MFGTSTQLRAQQAHIARLEEEARAKAEDIRKRLLEGEPFPRLAADLSDSPSKANGGLVGPITIDVLAPDLQKAIQDLKVGELTPVLALLGRTTARHPALRSRLAPLEEVLRAKKVARQEERA